MTNHVHLLFAPGEAVAAMGKTMKALSARATRYRNTLDGRSGALSEGRDKSGAVQTDQYLLACNRYIEMNPARARMVSSAGQYEWSSHRRRVGIASDTWIDYDPCCPVLAKAHSRRCLEYKRYVSRAIQEKEPCLNREAVQRGQLTGTDRFIDEVEKIPGPRVEVRARGRPCGGERRAN